MISEQSSSLSTPEESDLRTENRRNQESAKVYPDHNQCEQEVKFLKLKLAQLEEEKAAKMKIFNEETSNLESQVARLRAQMERGEATRQNLEYELTLAKKATNQVRRIAVEKDAETNSKVASLKEQISELKTKLSEVEQGLSSTKNQTKDDKELFDRELQQKETDVRELMSQLENSQNENNRLHQIVQEQQNSMLELQEKCASLEAQRQSQNNTLRHQAKDLEHGVDREGRIKKEFEQTRERVKNLEEHVEAERASHLETKFNSEIVQLRIRDLEGDLEVKNAALGEAVEKLEMLTKHSSEVEKELEMDKGKCEDLLLKLKQLHEKYSNENKRTKEDGEEKQKVIEGLSEQLEIHQQDFDTLKKELNQAKIRQNEFDQNYSGCLKDLEKLVETFGKSKSSKTKSKTGRSKDRLMISPSSALIDDIREILLDHQTTRTNAVNEAKKLKIMTDNLSLENTGYQELMWSRDKAVEDVRGAAKSMKHELSQAQVELANRKKICAALEVELETLKQQLGEERRNCEQCNEELAETKNQQVSDDKTRLSFLHAVYQCLVAGQFLETPPSGSYESFTWDDMMRLLSDQIGNHISELNRAKEKVSHLEEMLNTKEQHINQTQDNHEATIKKLSTTLKEREKSWKMQGKELEDHYGKLITDLHLRVQKTQEMADESWQKAQQTATINEELEIQKKSLKNSRKKYIKEKTALLASCALLAGTLWPACVQIEILRSQKRTLTSINSRLNDLQKRTRFLCETLNSELSGVTSAASLSIRSGQPGSTLLLKFRVGVVAILALNRLVNFGGRRKTCILLSQGAVEGLDATRVVHCGGSTQQTAEFRGIGQKCLYGPSLRQVSPAWFSNEKLLSHAVTSMNDLCEKISSPNEKDSSRSWSPDSCVTISRIAKHCYEKLLNKLRSEFYDDDADIIVSSFHIQSSPRNNLVLALGNGLHRCLKKITDSGRHRYTTTQELITSLQNFVLGLTQRLHNVEVERRDLRLEVTALKKEKDELRKVVEKRQLESQDVYRDIEGMREKLTSSVPRSQFEKLYSELSNALEREKQAQKILNNQAAQLKDMEHKLNMVNNNSEQSEATLAEAIKNLSEAKMEARRKEQTVRQVSKDTHLVENEKRLLQEKLNDAEKTMTGAARERETILMYLKGIQQGLGQSKASLKQSSKRRSLQELSNFLVSEGELASEGYPLGPAILACQSVVNGFLEIHQQTLVLLSQLEAEKQQAQIRIGSLETEINSHRTHINSLKDELAAVCQRQFNDEEIHHYGRSHLDENTEKLYNLRRGPDFDDQRESESHSREFVPLMRYDSPDKSPRKDGSNAPYSSSHRHSHDARPDYRDSRNTKTSRS